MKSSLSDLGPVTIQIEIWESVVAVKRSMCDLRRRILVNAQQD